MNVFQTWLFGVVAASMALAILYALLPKTAVLTAAKCTGGLVLLLVVVRPLLSLDMDALRGQYAAWGDAIEQQTQEYAAEGQQELERIIVSRCSAYISERAAALGLSCTSEIVCRMEEGVPIPAEVTLDIPQNAALSQIIEDELGIDAAHQHWKEAE